MSQRRGFLPIAALATLFLVCFLWPLAAEEPGKTVRLERLSILPSHISLNHPHATQKLVVEAYFADGTQEDWTEKASFASTAPAIAAVDEAGMVRAVSDGEATLTADVAGRKATASAEVRNIQAPFTRSFKNHVIPVMTKAGCNSGPCHGAAAGKNGFKLTLRGYDPATDYEVLTRQALGRRFGVKSPSYRIISDWIAAGTPPPSLDASRIESLEVLPAQASLRPGGGAATRGAGALLRRACGGRNGVGQV